MLKALVATALLLCGPAIAGEREDAARCAAYDLHFRTILEDLGETEEAGPVEMSVATFLNWQAWRACLRGDYATAFEAYEAIDLPTPSLALLEDLRAAHWLAGTYGGAPHAAQDRDCDSTASLSNDGGTELARNEREPSGRVCSQAAGHWLTSRGR